MVARPKPSIRILFHRPQRSTSYRSAVCTGATPPRTAMSDVTGIPVPKRHHVDLGPVSKIASTAAATAVSSSTDIIFEILSRLPVKTLCRFRCVSKRWHSLVSDPAFTAAHQSLAEPLLVGTVRGDETLRLMDMEGNVVRSVDCVHRSWMLKNSIDDLVCFSSDQHPYPEVIDLATGKMLLTRSDIDDEDMQWYDYVGYSFGFGRTALSRVYKVVRLKEHIVTRNGIEQTSDVLTLGDSSGWRHTELPNPIVDCHQSSVAINGVLHFLMLSGDNIICFDLESESWNKDIEGPRKANYDNDLWEDTWDNNIAKLNDTLCMVQRKVHTSGQKYTDIWLLNDSDNSIWCKTYTIRVVIRNPLKMMDHGGKLLFYYRKDNSSPMIQIYDPRDETCTDVAGITTDLTGTIVLCNLRLSRFFSDFLSLV